MRPEKSTGPFRDTVRELLREQGSSIRDIARRLDLDPTYISRVVSRQKPLPAGLPERVAVALGLPADFFPETQVERIAAAAHADAELRETLYRLVQQRQ